jgi:NADH-quinone oxidoreductase subunit J
MTLAFALIAILTIASAVAAMSLRNLVHCALAVALTFVGLAAAFLQLDAQFAGLAQILVYVGAVAILIVFTVLLTRGGEPGNEPVFSARWLTGVAAAGAVFAVVAGCIMASSFTNRQATSAPETTVKQIGEALMTKFVLPLEVLGLLLTAAMIGAVIIAMKDASRKVKIEDGGSKMESSNRPSSILHPPSSRGGHP